MKKKIITALILIGAGGLFIAAGYRLGGSVSSFDFYATGWPAWGDIKEDSVTFSDESIVQEIQGTAKHLYVAISHVASLKIIPHDKPSISYAITDNTELVGAAVSIQDDTLRITTKKYRTPKKPFFGIFNNDFNKIKTVIVVKIPQEAVFDTVTIDSGVAATLLDGIHAVQSFSLTCGVGTTEVREVTASHVKIETGIGTTVFKNCTFTDTEMHAGIGATTLNGKIAGNLTIEGGIGTVTVNIDGRKDDYSINAVSGIGHVTVGGVRAAGFISESYRKNSAAPNTISIESGIGNVRINFTEKTEA